MKMYKVDVYSWLRLFKEESGAIYASYKIPKTSKKTKKSKRSPRS